MAPTEQEPHADALEAVRSAIEASSKSLLERLEVERSSTAGEVPRPVASGLRLAYALGQMTEGERKALLVGAELADDQRQLLVGVLMEID